MRTTLAAEPASHEYYAMHEMATANSEQLIFDNIAKVRDDKPGSIHNDDTKAARLNADDPDRRIGTAIMLRVMPGDEFTFAADAYYEEDEAPQDSEHTGAEEIVSSLLATLSGGTVGGEPVGETENGALINELFSRPETITGIENILNSSSTSGTAPRAGLNYLFFDEQMNLLSGSGRLNVDHLSTGVFGNLSASQVSIEAPGYVIVYVDNQTIGKDVWFDNVQVLHYNTKVLEENHYYPFGLTVSTSAIGITQQPLKYNGKELVTNFDLQTYDYGARLYNSQIGRWNGVDPLADKYYPISPFAYVANNPVKFIDPDGKKIIVYDNSKAYEYVPGVKPAVGSPEILMKVHEAAMYNMQTKTGQRLWNWVGRSEKIFTIKSKEATIVDKNTDRFIPITEGRKDGDVLLGNIDWDMNSRAITQDNGYRVGYLSPSTKLLHEIGHVYRMINALAYGVKSQQWAEFKAGLDENMGFDAQYDTKEERENTEQNEHPYILEINEIEKNLNGENASYQSIRYDHWMDIEYKNNNADVNRNPSRSEQKKIFLIPD